MIYFVIAVVIIVLNPVLFPIIIMLIWLWLATSIVYLLFFYKEEAEQIKDAKGAARRAETIAICLFMLIVLPILAIEMWEPLGVTVPYSIVWSWAKYWFIMNLQG